jgi:hypothetical protein
MFIGCRLGGRPVGWLVYRPNEESSPTGRTWDIYENGELHGVLVIVISERMHMRIEHFVNIVFGQYVLSCSTAALTSNHLVQPKVRVAGREKYKYACCGAYKSWRALINIVTTRNLNIFPPT